MSDTTRLPELEWTNDKGLAEWSADGTLTLTAARGVDWSNDPLSGGSQWAATGLTFAAPPEFALSARVSVVSPRTTFDAAVLCLWADRNHWAKLCFEYSPRGVSMVVSVVTNTFSDDCNGSMVDDSVHLRVSRIGPAWAFHASASGSDWDFVRLFRLDTDSPVRVGFLAQAPTGEYCQSRFDDIRLVLKAPADLRDGS